MKTIFIFLFCLTSLSFGEPDYRGEFYAHFNQGHFRDMETTLKAWKAECPDDVEMLAAYGSYYYNQSKRGPAANHAKLTARGDILLNEPPPDKNNSDPGSQARFERRDLAQAVHYWKKAESLYPGRLDIRFRLARAYQEMDNFQAQYQTLAEALQYADQNKKKLKWINNEELPQRRSQLIPETLQNFEAYYFSRQQSSCDEKAFRLAKLTITFYPNHPYAYNSMAAYYSFQKDWEHALKYLLLASQRDPRDSLVLNNIGNLLWRLEKKQEAKIYYEKVIRISGDEKNTAHAQKKLEELKEN